MTQKVRKRGRPRKEVDPGIIFHMLQNAAPNTTIARQIGVHRDTIYTNYKEIIKEGRISHNHAWRKLMDLWFADFLEKKRLKTEPKKKKRPYRWKSIYRRGRW